MGKRLAGFLEQSARLFTAAGAERVTDHHLQRRGLEPGVTDLDQRIEGLWPLFGLDMCADLSELKLAPISDEPPRPCRFFGIPLREVEIQGGQMR